ncbi:hypothetical protein [Candidatus Coxiella mudrowiae]|uniref:hypothetical protein n=1 Tax=Candidatus Coxiella mudrowiae TaxID=2054173 RepID=UPI0012FEDC56|nr:hypothetical protein [Candidatus Coxiella mudrowiae]
MAALRCLWEILLTTVTYKLPIKAFVFNNDKLGLVRMKMEAAEYPECGLRLCCTTPTSLNVLKQWAAKVSAWKVMTRSKML